MADRYVRVRYDDGSEEIVPESSVGGLETATSSMVPPIAGPIPSLDNEDRSFEPLLGQFQLLEKQKQKELQQRLAERSIGEQLGLGAYGAVESAGLSLPSAIMRQVAPKRAKQLAQEYSQFKEERPATTFASELISQMANPALRAGGAVVQGGLEAIRGAMQPGTIGEKATQAVVGGTLGAGSALLGALGGRILGSTVKKGEEALVERGLSEAERQVAQRATRGGVDVAEAMAAQPAPTSGGGYSREMMTTAETLGIPIAPLAKAPESAAQIKTFLQTREKGARGRMAEATSATFEIPTNTNKAIADRRARMQARQLGRTAQSALNTMAEEVYGKLNWQNQITPGLIKQTKQKATAAETSAILDQYGVPFTKTSEGAIKIPKKIEGAFTELEGLRQSKIGLQAFEATFAGEKKGLPNPDDLTLRDYKQISSTLKKWAEGSKEARPTALQGVRASELMKVSKQMDEQLKKTVRGLKQADIQFPNLKKSAFGGMSDDAQELFSSLGRTKPLRGQQVGDILLNADPKVVQEVVAGVQQMGDGAALDKFKTSVGSYVNSLARSKAGRRKLQEILDPAAPEREVLEQFVPSQKLAQLEATTAQEATMQESFQRALKNSTTAEALIERETMKGAKSKDVAQTLGRIFRSPGQSLEKALDLASLEQLDPKVRQEVASILLETGPASYERMIKLRPIVERLKRVPEYGDIGAKIGQVIAPKLVGPATMQTSTQKKNNFQF